MMSKDAYWFPHDANARTDPKMCRLLMLGGQAAKGSYWDMIEILREAPDYRIAVSEIEGIAFSNRFPADAVAHMLEVGLLESDGEHVWSDSLLRRMERWDEIREKRRVAGRIGGSVPKRKRRKNQDKPTPKASAKQVLSKSEAKPKQSQARTGQNRTGEDRTRQDPDLPLLSASDHTSDQEKSLHECSAGKPARTRARSTPSASKRETVDGEQVQGFDWFWFAYPRKVGKAAARSLWNKLSRGPDWPGDERIVLAIERAKRTEQWQRDGGQFIPHPATWLRQGRWDDEEQVKGQVYHDLIDEIRREEKLP